jgi:tRNA1(Val) A37 N6-methylase TrmN6
MFGSKIIYKAFSSIQDTIKSAYDVIRNFPSWYMGKILEFINYFAEVKYKVNNLRETNFNLGIDHIYKNNLNDAILRLKLVDKFFAPSDHQANYWLGWVYFLKNNYEKSLFHLQKSFEADEVKLREFLQNYKNLSEMPMPIWRQYKNLTAKYYANKFRASSKIYLPYSFASITMNKITDLPDNYRILELGSNTGLVGYEVKKRFPDSFTFTATENSELMSKFAELPYVNMNIYDQLLNTSIVDFIAQSSAMYDVIISFDSLAFTKDLAKYFKIIYAMVNNSGYFSFCLPIDQVTHLSLKSKEFIFSIEDIQNSLAETNFTILHMEKLDLEKNGKYYMVVCRKSH